VEKIKIILKSVPFNLVVKKYSTKIKGHEQLRKHKFQSNDSEIFNIGFSERKDAYSDSYFSDEDITEFWNKVWIYFTPL
jgi:hypothetical protein